MLYEKTRGKKVEAEEIQMESSLEGKGEQEKAGTVGVVT